jgi:hypothetical protein
MKFAFLCGAKLEEVGFLRSDGTLDLKELYTHLLYCDSCGNFFAGILIGTCSKFFKDHKDT